MDWPITFADVLAAERRIRPYLRPTPLRNYAELDAVLGGGTRVWVKHENHHPTNAFKVRNAVAAMTRLSEAQRRAGVVAATRGNHGLGVACAASWLGISATICVPVGNNPEKNAGIRGFGARLVESGADYEESVAVADALVREHGLTVIHATNDREVLAGAGTMTLEVLRDRPEIDAMVIAVGGGSQAVGAMTVARAWKPGLRVYGVQAAGAPAGYESWRARRPLPGKAAETFADGLATRAVYDMTFPALCEGLADFVTVSEAEIAEAIRTLLATTHNLAEGAGAAGWAGLRRLQRHLRGTEVAVMLSGGNIDAATLERVVDREL